MENFHPLHSSRGGGGGLFFFYDNAPLQSAQKLNHPVIEMKTKEREEENAKKRTEGKVDDLDGLLQGYKGGGGGGGGRGLTEVINWHCLLA